MLPKYIKKFEDLITTHSEIKKGFLNQAIKKGEISEPIIKNAKKFYIALNGVDNLEKVLSSNSFQEELISAAGFSQKSLNHLSSREIKDSLKKVFLKLFRNDNEFFREEIVYRYLLTKGDSLGGSMRNIVGAAAGERLTKILLFILKRKKYKPKISRNGTGKVNNISWNNRFLIFDYKPRMIGNNIDIILFDASNIKSINEIFDNPNKYLACGELKGGIDPAGADEHWKTANHALERIRTCFAKENNKPKLFFIGAAVEQAMAKEIFNQLSTGKLTYVANLNQKSQMFDLADWLTNL